MRNRIATLTLAAAAVFVLAGCSSAPTGDILEEDVQTSDSYQGPVEDTRTLPADVGSFEKALPDGTTVICVWHANNNGSGGLDCIDATWSGLGE